MTYPKSMLNDGEEIVLDRHPHWTYLIGPTSMVVLAVVAAVLLTIWGFWWAGAAIVAASALVLGVTILRWRNIQFVVTTDRIITRVGILAKAGTEIPLDRVMNISYRQSFQERIFRVGDLVIESAGENGQQFFSDVSEPSQVQNIIYRQTEIYTQRGPNNGMGDDSGPRESGERGSDSIPEQISQLDKLRQQGILTDDEFRQKKRELLDRL